MLHDFNEILFTRVPCEKLEAEDKRLAAQDEETKTWWERMKQGSGGVVELLE